MAGTKDAMGSFGTLLGLLGGIIALVLMLLGLFDIALDFIPSQSFIDISLGISLNVGNLDLLRLIWALLLLFVCTGKINIGEPILEGIVILILGLLLGSIGGILAIVGGLLIILDAIF